MRPAQPPHILPVDDAHLPLVERRFPFRAAGPHEVADVREAAGKAIEGVMDMLYTIAYRYTRHRHDAEDLVQEAAMHLHMYSLSRFDAHTGTKLSTFLHICARRYMFSVRRTARRPAKYLLHAPSPLHMMADDHHALRAPERQSDRAIEALADDIAARPEKYLTGPQANVFKVIWAGGLTPKQQLARTMGYRNAGNFVEIITRIRKRIEDMAGGLLAGDEPHLPVRAKSARRPKLPGQQPRKHPAPDEIATICQQLATGMSVRAVARANDRSCECIAHVRDRSGMNLPRPAPSHN